MLTYYLRTSVNYGVFKRDCIFFKSVTMVQIFYLLLEPVYTGQVTLALFPDTQSLLQLSAGITAIISGYLISTLASISLGLDGTYFGIELGHVKANYQFVKEFPYNIFPHPMILGQVVALLGWYPVVYFPVYFTQVFS